MKIISVQPTYTRFTNTFKKNSIAQEERNIENQKHDLDNETDRLLRICNVIEVTQE